MPKMRVNKVSDPWNVSYEKGSIALEFILVALDIVGDVSRQVIGTVVQNSSLGGLAVKLTKTGDPAGTLLFIPQMGIYNEITGEIDYFDTDFNDVTDIAALGGTNPLSFTLGDIDSGGSLSRIAPPVSYKPAANIRLLVTVSGWSGAVGEKVTIDRVALLGGYQ